MNRSGWVRMLCTVVVTASLVATGSLVEPGALRADEKTDKAELLAASAGFYAALNAVFRGDAGPMAEVWSHGEDINYMGPTGLRQSGWKAVHAEWKTQAGKRWGGEVKLVEPEVQSGGSLAVITGMEVGENIVEGQSQKVSIRATSVFRKENGHWKMIGHHTDKLAFLDKKN